MEMLLNNLGSGAIVVAKDRHTRSSDLNPSHMGFQDRRRFTGIF
jgi:hypothetical protein